MGLRASTHPTYPRDREKLFGNIPRRRYVVYPGAMPTLVWSCSAGDEALHNMATQAWIMAPGVIRKRKGSWHLYSPNTSICS